MHRCNSCGMFRGRDGGGLFHIAESQLCSTCCAAYLRRVRALVAEQAIDEGLWFHPETAPEAYLQEALRKLHLVAGHQKATRLRGSGEGFPSPRPSPIPGGGSPKPDNTRE